MARLKTPPSRLTHGLRSREVMPSPDAAEVRSLSSGDAITRELEGVFASATWLALQLKEAPVLSSGDLQAVVYADAAGRAVEAMLAVESGTFTDRYGRAGRSAGNLGSGSALAKAIQKQQVVTAFVLTRTKRAFAWLKQHGVYGTDGKPQGALKWFGIYLNKSVRACLVLASMLAVARDGEIQDLSLSLQEVLLESGSNGEFE
jgi:hypothetical protein